MNPALSPFADQTLADIATSLPGATAVFRRHKLDFCCGGQQTLAAAAAARQVGLQALEDELDDIVSSGQLPRLPLDIPSLIDMIETRFHATHRRELPELIHLARKVEAVHRGYANVPAGLADLLERTAGELEVHMKKEELILFPMMRRGGHPAINQPIAVMLAEHEDHGAHLREIEALTNDFIVPDGACSSWRALYAGCRKFTDDLMEHVHTENNVLFPRFA